MGVREGLPDFQAALDAGDAHLFAPFGAGPFAVLPTEVVVATTGGRLALCLTLVSQPDQPGAAGDYAMLDIWLEPRAKLDDALAAARAVHPGATVAPAIAEFGFARLASAGAATGLPAAALSPTPLGWLATGARWSLRLDPAAGALLKSGLLDRSLLLRARLEFSVRGVAPRMAATASFVPSAVIAGAASPPVAGSPPASPQIVAVPRLLARLTDPATPIAIVGADRALVAQALCDRILATWGMLVPSPGPDDPPCFAFAAPLPDTRADWDLSVPAEGLRGFALQLDPLAAARAVADPAALIREISVPPLDLGFRDIVVAANLPPCRAGIPALGVRISLPPAPPGRPSGIDASAVFAAPDDVARLSIRLGMDEPLAYTATPFAILAAGGTVQQLEAAPIAASTPFLRLQPADFPVVFAHIVASDRLLAQCIVSGALSYAHGSGQAAQTVALRQDAPEVSVAAPAAADDARLALGAVADGTTLALSPQRPGPVRLDLPSFPGYGPHRITVSVALPAGEAPLALAFQSEDGATSGEAVLTPDSPSAIWGYVAASPFRCGYRVRRQGGTWSAVLKPGAALTLAPDGSLAADATPAPPGPIEPDTAAGADTQTAFDLDGVRLSPDPDGATLRYLPAGPAPELDAHGRPTLAIFKTASGATLQIGARFALTPDRLAALQRDLSAQKPALAGARLQPEAVQVQSAALILADDAGNLATVTTAPASAFPPYGAVFHAALTQGQAAQAIAAAGGRRGLLLVAYSIVVQGGTPDIRRADVADWLSGDDGLSHVHIA